MTVKRTTLAILAIIVMIASTSFAATQAANVATIAPTMTVSATIQKAVSLTLSTGTSTASHCAVSAGGSSDYAMDFGTVDALAINNGGCNKFAPVTPGSTNAIYWSDYNLLPVFSSHTSASGTTITAQVTSNFAASNIFIVRDSANSSTVPTAAGQFIAMGTSSADTIGAAGVVSGTSLTRFLGVAVTPANGAGVQTGAQTATVTFTLTVQ
jgi:hypothetical protein